MPALIKREEYGMTRDEAISILWQYDVNFEPHPSEDVMHAIDMAIEALKAQEEKRTETHSCDCISRSAAIRWIKTECNPYGKPTFDFESEKRL